MMVYDLNDFMILNIKGVNDAIKLLNNFVLDNKGVL